MYRARDFDSEQIVARRDKDRRAHKTDDGLRPLLPWNSKELIQDLGLNILLNAMADGEVFLFEVAKVALLASVIDIDTIQYRQEIYRDCVKEEPLVRQVYQIAVEAIEGERKNYWSSFGRYPSGTLHRAVDVLQLFAGKLKLLRTIADENADRFESEGLTNLLAMLRRELSDAYLAEVERHLATLRFRKGMLLSAGLGQSLKATDYVLRKPHDDKRNWIVRMLSPERTGFTFHLHPRDEAGARALSEIADQGVNLVANALAQSTDHILSFFEMLRTELAFYIGCLNLQRRLEQLQQPICFPKPCPTGISRLEFLNLSDASLVLSGRSPVIANDLNADDKQLVIITGANTGGKSTFMRSLGVAQLMMQAGMFVTAERFDAQLHTALCTHYRREEDIAMESGKLDEELKRMSIIVDHLTPGAMILFNESFAATNEREGSEIAYQVASALLERGVKVCFVTHLYEFARAFHAENFSSVLFLRADRRSDGTRTFKVIEGEPLQTSYGEDLYMAVFGQGRPPDAGRPVPAQVGNTAAHG
jgi:DNA mismatch repair ATPase MutS